MREQQRVGRVGSNNESEKTRMHTRAFDILHDFHLAILPPPSTLTPPSLPPIRH